MEKIQPSKKRSDTKATELITKYPTVDIWPLSCHSNPLRRLLYSYSLLVQEKVSKEGKERKRRYTALRTLSLPPSAFNFSLSLYLFISLNPTTRRRDITVAHCRANRTVLYFDETPSADYYYNSTPLLLLPPSPRTYPEDGQGVRSRLSFVFLQRAPHPVPSATATNHQTVPDPLVNLSAFALATSTPVSTSSSSQVSSFSHRRRRSSAATGGAPQIPQTLNVQDANDLGRGGSSLSPIPGMSTPSPLTANNFYRSCR